jgi:ubiquinone/menaquinone biosynthesis C-methylase UbiE
MDRSPDMLQQALKKGEPLNLRGELRQGNILQTGLPDDEVDVAVNCRITRWVIGEHGPAGIQQMLREMQRVAKKRIILTARVANHPYAVSMDLIESALGGWRVARNEAGYVLDYRVLALEAVA